MKQEEGQWPVTQLLRMSRKVNKMYYHVKSRSQIKLEPSEYEWEQLANKIDVIHDVIMNNRYNGSQRQKQQQQQQYPPKSCVFCSSFDHRSNNCPSQQCYSCQEYGHFASECPWNGFPFDDDFPESCNPDEEIPSEPAQAMDVEPSMTPAVLKHHQRTMPSPTSSKTAKETCRHSIQNQLRRGWRKCLHQKCLQRKSNTVKPSSNVNWSKDTVTTQLDIKKKSCSVVIML